jgi:hypothetical protein
MSQLPHADFTEVLLIAGEREEARKAHNARVESELARARAGEVINLSDLMAAREAFEVR